MQYASQSFCVSLYIYYKGYFIYILSLLLHKVNAIAYSVNIFINIHTVYKNAAKKEEKKACGLSCRRQIFLIERGILPPVLKNALTCAYKRIKVN